VKPQKFRRFFAWIAVLRKNERVPRKRFWLKFIHRLSRTCWTFWCMIYPESIGFTILNLHVNMKVGNFLRKNDSFSFITQLHVSWSCSNFTHVFSQVIQIYWSGFRFWDIDISRKNDCQSGVFYAFSSHRNFDITSEWDIVSVSGFLLMLLHIKRNTTMGSTRHSSSWSGRNLSLKMTCREVPAFREIHGYGAETCLS
jgi:hypothetical protein